MKTHRFKNYEALSDFAAAEIAIAIKEKPSLVLCMASGHTPARTAELLVTKLQQNNIDYSRLQFFGLDEWVGLPPTNEGSCQYFFNTRLVKPLSLQASQCFFFDALSNNLPNECKKMDDAIAARGGIDIMLVGIGMNGHIGFNEPGTPTTITSHVAALDDITKEVGQKYFASPMPLDKGITIGLGHLLGAKKVFLLANGSKKASVIKQTVEGVITEKFPASIMQRHANGHVLIDEEAGALLTHRK